MRIKQAYIGKQVKHFPWFETFGVVDYMDVYAPTVFFGCYTRTDFENALYHQGEGVMYWAGRDVLKWKKEQLQELKRYRHVTGLPMVAEFLRKNGIEPVMVKPHMFSGLKVNPVKKQNKIYSYYQRNGVYSVNGNTEIDQYLQKRYTIQIPQDRINWEDWYGGVCEGYYNCFVGLMLDDFGRGATTIKDLGLRGIRCVTNVIALPNTIPWKTKEDIYKAIQQEQEKVGTIDGKLAQEVWDCLDTEYEWLEI